MRGCRKPVTMVRIRVSTTAGRRYFVKNVFISRFLSHKQGGVTTSQVPPTRLFFLPLCLPQGQVQELQNQVDVFDPREGADDATDAVDRRVAAQQRTCPDAAALHTPQS